MSSLPPQKTAAPEALIGSPYSFGVVPIHAVYLAATLPSELGNPLIEALPAIKDDTGWLEQLLSLPTFDEGHLELEAYLRSYCVAELKNAFIPSARHLSVARRIDQLIRWGYRKRNPLLPERATALQKSYERAQASREHQRIVFAENQPICSYSLVGASGLGKSTTMESILNAYPQYILHPSHNLFQIVWLKVECPKDGSVKELALSILRGFDRVLGTHHAPDKSSNITTSFLTNKVNHLALTYSLGLLVLDELQNLSIKKSGGREEMLNWFQELVNELRLPVVMMGTFKARSVLQLDVRHSRRNAITGSATWRPMEMGPEFLQLLQNIWEYQWLRNPGELTSEMAQVIFDETQGVNAFVVDMFLIAQLYALRNNVESLTSKLFKTVARTEFEPLQSFLNALRSKDPNRLKKFEDALGYDIEELIEKEQRLITHGQPEKNPTAEASSLTARATANVRSTLGLTEPDARKLVLHVLDGSQQTVQAITKAALSAYFRMSEESSS